MKRSLKLLVALVETLDKHPVGGALTLALMCVGASAAALVALAAR